MGVLFRIIENANHCWGSVESLHIAYKKGVKADLHMTRENKFVIKSCPMKFVHLFERF